tara:strand:- start:1937 stop:2404 length:468 start_codon:yes stop_codon:yes gene_type:complete
MKKLLESYLTLKDDILVEKFNSLVTVVGDVYKMPPKELMVTSGRKREIVQARNMVCSIMRSCFDLSLDEIAERLGYKSHASVIHALKMHEMDLKFSRSYSKKYHSIMECMVEINHDNKSVELDVSKETMRMFHLRLLSFETKLNELTRMFNKKNN